MGLSLKDKTFSTKYHVKDNTAREAFKPWYMLSKLHCGTCSSISDTSSNRTCQMCFLFRIVCRVYAAVKWKNNEVCNDWFKFLTDAMVFIFKKPLPHNASWTVRKIFILFSCCTFIYFPCFSLHSCPSRYHSCCVLGMEVII